MSEQKWQHEPWNHVDRFGAQAGDLSRVALDYEQGGASLVMNNLDRACKCVTAMRGIPDPAALVAERDALVATLAKAIEEIEGLHGCMAMGPYEDDYARLEIFRAALAKARANGAKA